MKLVGLTGGICCGKSTVVRILRSLDADGGAHAGRDAPKASLGVVDCDLIARDVVRPGAWGYRRVVRAFGASILQDNGALDREKLGGLVFNDVAARKRLNAATHLPILVRMVTQILTLWVWERCSMVVVDMPLLYEIGFQRFTRPYTVVVACRPETQVARLRARDGLSHAEAQARVDAQMKIDDKVNLADYVIPNEDGDIDRLEKKVEEVFREIARAGPGGQVWGRWATWFLIVTVAAIAFAAIKMFLYL